MKITDLMHGDWFNSKKGTCRISEIFLFTAIVEMSNEAYKECNESFFEADFEYDLNPIDINIEILKANDFLCVGENLWALYPNPETTVQVYKYPNTNTYRLKIEIYSPSDLSFTPIIISIFCKHVHELQHGFRVAELNDLADNFILTPLKFITL